MVCENVDTVYEMIRRKLAEIRVNLGLLNAEDDQAKLSRLSYVRRQRKFLDPLSGFNE